MEIRSFDQMELKNKSNWWLMLQAMLPFVRGQVRLVPVKHNFKQDKIFMKYIAEKGGG